MWVKSGSKVGRAGWGLRALGFLMMGSSAVGVNPDLVRCRRQLAAEAIVPDALRFGSSYSASNANGPMGKCPIRTGMGTGERAWELKC